MSSPTILSPTILSPIKSNPHLEKWKKELQETLVSSIHSKKSMEHDIEKFESIKENQNKDIEKLDSIYKNTLEYASKKIYNYIKSVQDNKKEIHNYIKSLQNNEKEIQVENKDYIENTNNTKNIFDIYKKMYRDAVSFFSQKDFTYHESKLDNTKTLFSFFDEEQVWTDVQLSIWSQELVCKDIKKQKIILEKKYNTLLKDYTIKKELYDNLEKNIKSLEKKIQDIDIFSKNIEKED